MTSWNRQPPLGPRLFSLGSEIGMKSKCFACCVEMATRHSPMLDSLAGIGRCCKQSHYLFENKRSFDVKVDDIYRREQSDLNGPVCLSQLVLTSFLTPPLPSPHLWQLVLTPPVSCGSGGGPAGGGRRQSRAAGGAGARGAREVAGRRRGHLRPAGQVSAARHTAGDRLETARAAQVRQ